MEKIGVVGGGTMGAGIAEVSARAGCDVVVSEVTPASARRAHDRVEASLARAVRSGRVDSTVADEVLGRLRVDVGLDCLADRDVVIEAAPEDETLKLEMFRRLDDVLPEGALLASNTSSIPLVKMAAVTRRPASVVGIHFFNPVPVLPLVEIVESLLTSADTRARATAFVEGTLASRRSCPRTVRGSSSTRCSSPTCCRRSA